MTPFPHTLPQNDTSQEMIEVSLYLLNQKCGECSPKDLEHAGFTPDEVDRHYNVAILEARRRYRLTKVE
ncbi:hypothetical protein [Kiloniella laminariae]|uniref:hypothetical protein n=1 Tax=Kiloniella laminariae TaxID=454162 RepID=UPI0003620460|nr:hypothetical protein [Kiloniella laminariae]